MIHSQSDSDQDDRRFLGKEACFALGQRVMGFARGGGDTSVYLMSEWHADFRWSRNRTTIAADRRDTNVYISRSLQGTGGSVATNQIDDRSLQNAMQSAERSARHSPSQSPDIRDERGEHSYPNPAIWSETTFQQPPSMRGSLAVEFMATVEKEGMTSAGYMHLAAQGQTALGTTGPVLYYPRTYAECSITVRDPKNAGSGWAGGSSYDWSRFDARTLAEIALDKCRRSRNPVAVEPGRYVAILEPQAVYDLARWVVDSLFRDPQEETIRPIPQGGYYADGRGTLSYRDLPVSYGVSKLGQQILDRRITIRQDPLHPDLGTWPYASPEDPIRPVTWFDQGVLSNLTTDRWYAVTYWNEHEGFPNSGTFHLSGGLTSIDEMVATTKRGILVSRFTQITMQHAESMLLSGYTRDGLWLIENGKIAKSIKNFRFTDSPFFALNQVDQMGVPVPVFSPGSPAIVPSLKIRDFNFSSLADAV